MRITDFALNAILLSLGAISTSVFHVLRNAWKTHRTVTSPLARDSILVRAADEALGVVAHSRDELQEDNQRLREQLVEERKRNDALHLELSAVEAKLRTALEDLSIIKVKHGIPS